MAQVQLYLAKSQNGYKGLSNFNPSEDVVRHIHDFSTALDIIEYDASRPDIFYLIKYLEEGLLITLLRPLDGPKGSNYSATLFFPLGLKIDKDKFLEIIDTVSEVLRDGNDPGAETVGDLRQLLSADYGIDETRPHFRTSGGTTGAFVYIGNPAPTIGDYFDTRFYQPEYPEFSSVLLVDRITGAKGREGSRELSGELKKIYTVIPPKHTREGFQPTVFHEPFRRPVMAAKDSTLDIVWRRNGFESITTHVKVDKDRTEVPPCDTSGARKIVSPSSFYITEQHSRKLIKDFDVKVNGTPITGPTPFTFSELTHARVDISAPGCVNYSGNLDLAGSTQALVQMRKLHKSYRFDMPLQTPEPIEPLRIYIKTLKNLDSCPLEGYEVVGGEIVEGGSANNLIYVGGRSRTRTLISIGALVGALLLGFLIGWLVFSGSGKEEEPVTIKTIVTEPAQTATVTVPQEQPTESAPVEEVQPAEEIPAVTEQAAAIPTPAAETEALDYKAAVDYLENTKTWHREEMEAIPALRGLYNDLNEYNFERIKTYWAPLLKDSKRFNAIRDAVNGAATKRNPRTGDHNPTYNKPDDSAINWRQYTYWVDP